MRRLGTLSTSCAVACVLVGLAGADAGAQDKPPPQPRAERAAVSPPDAGVPIRMRMTVFQVRVPRERLPELDTTALAAAGRTAGQLRERLERYGAPEVLYHVDEVVRAGPGRTEVVRIDRSSGYPSPGPHGTPAKLPAITRANSRLEVNFRGVAVEGSRGRRLDVSLEIALECVTTTMYDEKTGTSVPVFWDVSQHYGGVVERGEPVVLLTCDGLQAPGESQGVAFVTLVTFGEAATP